MKEFTLGKSLTNVNSVTSVSLMPETSKFMKEFILVKSLMNVNSVASVLAMQVTLGGMKESTQALY